MGKRSGKASPKTGPRWRDKFKRTTSLAGHAKPKYGKSFFYQRANSVSGNLMKMKLNEIKSESKRLFQVKAVLPDSSYRIVSIHDMYYNDIQSHLFNEKIS